MSKIAIYKQTGHDYIDNTEIHKYCFEPRDFSKNDGDSDLIRIFLNDSELYGYLEIPKDIEFSIDESNSGELMLFVNGSTYGFTAKDVTVGAVGQKYPGCKYKTIK